MLNAVLLVMLHAGNAVVTWLRVQLACMQDLVEAMNAHLRLHFVNDELADQNVLSIYPTTLRRRALRHLYLQSTQM